jgi:hypothetical protein
MTLSAGVISLIGFMTMMNPIIRVMMKNCAPFFATVSVLFSVHCFAQRSENGPAYEMLNAELLASNIQDDDAVVVSYHVEERINMIFGGRVTTYNVTSLNYVDKNDLGPNNTRTVTPRFAKARPKVAPVTVQPVAPATPSEQPMAAAAPTSLEKAPPTVATVKERQPGTAYINITNTYERILNKGYRSVDMLKRVADSRFFDGDLDAAAKWYGELMKMTTNLDDAFYYRFSQALKFVGEIEKSRQMMEIFEKRTAESRQQK